MKTQFEKMMLSIKTDKLLTEIYDAIDKHDSLGRKESLFEIEDPEVCEIVEQSLGVSLCNV